MRKTVQCQEDWTGRPRRDYSRKKPGGRMREKCRCREPVRIGGWGPPEMKRGVPELRPGEPRRPSTHRRARLGAVHRPARKGCGKGACLRGEVTKDTLARAGGEMLCLHKATEGAGVTVRPLWHREPQRPRGQHFLSIVQENYRGLCHAMDGNLPRAQAPSPPCHSWRAFHPTRHTEAGKVRGLGPALSMPPKGPS